MSRRKTVKLNLPVVNPLIKQVFRSNVVFCEKMGRAQNWVTDWNRKDKDGKPKPKNPPSPEEAAQMCLLLNTTPEEILLGVGETEEDTAKLQADIALVRGLIEQEREQQGIKKDPTQTGEVDPELLEIWNSINTADRRFLVETARMLKARSESE